MRAAYRKRKIQQPPFFKNFKPSGIPRRMLKTITVSVDEYEAIRLADYLGMDHQNAAEEMAISRPTFTRLIEKARGKIAAAIVEGMEVVVEGGNFEFKNTRVRCENCGNENIEPFKIEQSSCSSCGSENTENLAHRYVKKKSGSSFHCSQ